MSLSACLSNIAAPARRPPVIISVPPPRMAACEQLRSLSQDFILLVEQWSCTQGDVLRLSTLATALIGLVDAAPEVCLGMAGYLDMRSPAMQHAFHVAIVAALLGRQCGMEVSPLLATVKAALVMNLPVFQLQDDLAIPLAQPTRGQHMTLQRHPLLAAELVAASPGADLRWIDAVEQHHEAMDGSGYPLGLAGEEIGDEARILHVADIWCGLTVARPQHSGFSPREALHWMRARHQQCLDTTVFSTLAHTLGAYPPGTLVRLVNREIALVTRFGQGELPPSHVIALLSAQNHLLREPVVRDTAKSAYGVRGYSFLPHIEIRPGHWNAVWHLHATQIAAAVPTD